MAEGRGRRRMQSGGEGFGLTKVHLPSLRPGSEGREEDGTYSGLVEEQYYWVAIVSFLTLPGKSPIGDLLVESVVGDTDYDVLVRYIKANSPIRESLEGRINVKYFA